METTHTVNESLRAALGITTARRYKREGVGRMPGAMPEDLLALRINLGLTQRQFAVALGCPPAFKSTVSHWERGWMHPRLGATYSERLAEMLAKARELGVLPAENGGAK